MNWPTAQGFAAGLLAGLATGIGADPLLHIVFGWSKAPEDEFQGAA